MFFAVNFAKFLRIGYIKEPIWWQLLIVLADFRVRKRNSSSLLSVYELKGTGQGLFSQFIACNNRTQSPALFSKYFQILYIFSQIFKYFVFLCPFLNFFALFLKNCTRALTFQNLPCRPRSVLSAEKVGINLKLSHTSIFSGDLLC